MIRVRTNRLHMRLLHTRFPFRYGIATMTQVPHVILELKVEIDGQLQVGLSADNLVPKWFTKDPDTSIDSDTEAMLRVIKSASDLAANVGECATVFELWYRLYQQMQADAQRSGDPPLLWGLGLSLVERAVMDAFCGAQSVNFSTALLQNRFGTDLARLYPEL